MTELADRPPRGDLTSPKEPTGTVQRAFTDFVNSLHDEETTVDAKALRVTRKPRLLRQKPQIVAAQNSDEFANLLDALSEEEHEETVQRFYPVDMHGMVDFKNTAEANFAVGGLKTRFRSIFLQEPVSGGAEFSLRVSESPDQRTSGKYIEIEGSLGNGIGASFSIRYDAKKGKLKWAKLQKTDGSAGEDRHFDDTEPHGSDNARDKAVGGSISIRVAPDATLLLRMPKQQDFARIIKTAFPPEVFREPSKTAAEQDVTWHGMSWLNGALGITLTKNGQTVPFPL